MELYGTSIFSEMCCFPQSLHQFAFPPTTWDGSLFSTSSPVFAFFFFFYDSHSNRYEVFSAKSLWGFSFPWWLMMLSILSCACYLSLCFGIMCVQVFCSVLNQRFFFFLMLNCMSCLCILSINPYSLISFAGIFSYLEGCVFILLMVSFAEQRILSLIGFHF